MDNSQKNQIQKCNEDIISVVAVELALPDKLIREVVQAQSAFTKQIMNENALESVLWPKFGRVRVKVKRLDAILYKIGNKIN